MRATCRPRHRCGPPPPNAMCGFGSRPTSKRSGSVEHVLVAVAGAVEHHQLVAGLDRLVVDDRVLHRRAPEVHDGRRVAQHLLDRRGEQPVDVGLQAGPLVRVVEELLDAGRQQVARRVAAGVDEQQEEPLQLARRSVRRRRPRPARAPRRCRRPARPACAPRSRRRTRASRTSPPRAPREWPRRRRWCASARSARRGARRRRAGCPSARRSGPTAGVPTRRARGRTRRAR